MLLLLLFSPVTCLFSLVLLSNQRYSAALSVLCVMFQVQLSCVVTIEYFPGTASKFLFYTLRTGLLNCLNARSRGLTFRHRASCI